MLVNLWSKTARERGTQAKVVLISKRVYHQVVIRATIMVKTVALGRITIAVMSVIFKNLRLPVISFSRHHWTLTEQCLVLQ